MASSNINSKGSDTDDSKMYEELVGKMFSFGCISLAYAAAQESGITDALCEASEPLTSTQIASSKKLKERYVREIVNALTTVGVVQLQEGTGTSDGREARYFVPEACKKSFHSGGVFCTAVSSCSRNFVAVTKCLELDGPSCIRYKDSTFDMLDNIGVMQTHNIVSAILKTPGLQQLLEDGIEVGEVGSGTGRLTCFLASRFPKSRFTVTDIAPEPLKRAETLAQEAGLTNVSIQVLDVCQIPDDWEGKFQWMYCHEVIHDLPHPLQALKGIHKALQRDGKFSMVDVFASTYVASNVGSLDTAALYALSTFMCIPESYQQLDSEALGACWGEEKARDLCAEAGFKVVGITRSGLDKDLGMNGVCMCEKC